MIIEEKRPLKGIFVSPGFDVAPAEEQYVIAPDDLIGSLILSSFDAIEYAEPFDICQALYVVLLTNGAVITAWADVIDSTYKIKRARR